MKRVLFMLFASVSHISYGQQKGTNDLHVSVGALTGNYLINVVSEIVVTGASLGNIMYDNNAVGSPAIVIEVDNVNETFNTLQNKGVTFLTEPQDMAAWEIKVIHFKDPENNLIELFSELPKEKWEEHLIEDEKNFKKSK